MKDSEQDVGEASPLPLADVHGPPDHVVSFYDSDPFYVESVARFVHPAVAAGDSAIVVATAEHRSQLDEVLTDRGVDVAAARADDRLITADASDTLQRIMRDGAPDPVAFVEVIDGLLGRAGAAGRPVRIHGEMVAVLWDRGEVAAAIALEERWNELAAVRDFALLCTYPMHAFDHEERTEPFRTVCEQHAAVIPSETYSAAADTDAQRRVVALLQQEASVGINARASLRRRQSELEDELRRSRALSDLRDELVSTLLDDLRPSVSRTGPRRRSVATFQKTATRTVRRLLHAEACVYEPDETRRDGPGTVRPGRDEPATEPFPVHAGTVAAPVASDEAMHGVLRVRFAPGRHANANDVGFVAAVARLLAVAIDHDRARRQLHDQALYDRLTGLPHRALLFDRIERALSRAARDGTRVAVMFVDLDRFKDINDGLGHQVGDHALVAAARRLAGALRPADTFARLGGDEFAAVCEGIHDDADALVLAQRLRDAISDPLVVDGAELSVTASVGLAIGRGGQSAEELLTDADRAMYRAKALGRNRVQLYDQQLGKDAAGYLELHAALRHAFERDELGLVYQPQIDLRTGRVAAIEAFLRWEHPARGRLTAAEFLPLAQSTDLKLALDRWALHTACAAAAQWSRERGGPAVAVNLSAEQLLRSGVVDTVTEALAAADLPADLLCIEVTENAVTQAPEEAAEALTGLAGLGVNIALDDFGVGCFSLSQLERLPLRSVKVDRSFVAGLGDSVRDWRVVSAAVRLASALDLVVVANGVEHAAQETELRALGCDRAQGHRWTQPVDLEQVCELLDGRPPR